MMSSQPANCTPSFSIASIRRSSRSAHRAADVSSRPSMRSKMGMSYPSCKSHHSHRSTFNSEGGLVESASVIVHTPVGHACILDAVRMVEAHLAHELLPGLDLHGLHALPDLLVLGANLCGVNRREIDRPSYCCTGRQHAVPALELQVLESGVQLKPGTVGQKLKVIRLLGSGLPVVNDWTLEFLDRPPVLTNDVDVRLDGHRKPWKAARGVVLHFPDIHIIQELQGSLEAILDPLKSLSLRYRVGLGAARQPLREIRFDLHLGGDEWIEVVLSLDAIAASEVLLRVDPVLNHLVHRSADGQVPGLYLLGLPNVRQVPATRALSVGVVLTVRDVLWKIHTFSLAALRF